MARLPRFVVPGQPQHVIQRGNNRMDIFRADDDHRFYLEKLATAAVKSDCLIHAYVLMSNHVHLLVTPGAENGIGKMMQGLGRYYVQYFNACYYRTGTLRDHYEIKGSDSLIKQGLGAGGGPLQAQD